MEGKLGAPDLDMCLPLQHFLLDVSHGVQKWTLDSLSEPNPHPEGSTSVMPFWSQGPGLSLHPLLVQITGQHSFTS